MLFLVGHGAKLCFFRKFFEKKTCTPPLPFSPRWFSSQDDSNNPPLNPILLLSLQLAEQLVLSSSFHQAKKCLSLLLWRIFLPFFTELSWNVISLLCLFFFSQDWVFFYLQKSKSYSRKLQKKNDFAEKVILSGLSPFKKWKKKTLILRHSKRTWWQFHVDFNYPVITARFFHPTTTGGGWLVGVQVLPLLIVFVWGGSLPV